MSSINVNLTELNGIKRSLEKSQVRLSRAADIASSVRIDGAIAARRSIASRLASASRSVQDVENQIHSLITFLGEAVQRYEHAEELIDKLLSGMQDFREKRSAWDWVVDQAEYVGDKVKEAWKSIDEFAQDTLDLIQAYTSAMCELIDQAMAAVNKGLDYLRDLAIAGGANPLQSYFLYGVLKGLVDTIGGALKLLIEVPWMVPKLVLTVEGYATDVLMSEDPFEKVKDDVMGLPGKAEAMYSAIEQAFADMKTEFMNADMNHKAEMIGFATEKVVELFIPGLGEAGLAKDVGVGARGLSAFAREGGGLFAGLSDNVLQQAFKSSMEKLLNYEIRGLGDSLVPAGIGGAVPGGTAIREILEGMGWVRKAEAPGGRMPEGADKAKLAEPTLPEGSRPKGNYEKPDPNDPRPKELQNEAADGLANKGYDVEMLPETKGGNGYGVKPTSNPDFLINGKAFDCFSPKSDTSVRNIWSTVKVKTEKQASHIVINLDDYAGSIDDVVKQFKEYKIETLGELLVIKDGNVIRLVP